MMMMIILIKYYAYFMNLTPKLLTQLITAICLVYSIQWYPEFTIILIMKPIIFILIMNKYLDISIYLDNRTPLW